MARKRRLKQQWAPLLVAGGGHQGYKAAAVLLLNMAQVVAGLTTAS